MSQTLIIIYVFVFGLLFGSFASVLKERIDNPKSIIFGRSRCPSCKHTLGFFDLFPILSFLLLFGKCRYCRKKISLLYPIVEVISGFLAVAVFVKFSISFSAVTLYLSLLLLVIASVSDLENQEVDLKIIILGLALALVWFFLKNGFGFQQLVFSVVSAGLIPLVFYLVSREKWMGLGDVLIAAWIGLLVFYPAAIVAIFFAFIIGSIFGIITLAVNPKIHRIAFGPCLALAGVVALFYGNQIFAIYLKFLGL